MSAKVLSDHLHKELCSSLAMLATKNGSNDFPHESKVFFVPASKKIKNKK
jgi:hypothetical protein